MSNLVIVESPSKATTIKSYLGSGYKVIASKGHVRDLPKSTLGIDIENGFAPHYINIRGKGDLLAEIRKEAKKAGKIYLATDPDREGEAISWHLAAALGINPDEALRITFNEVTKTAVKEAIKHPGHIDRELVDAQQARRILDRIVGYKLSPFLWKNVRSGLSAGRVQSVATRMIVEREEEIRAFKTEEYWTVDATLATEKGETFTVRFFGNADGKKVRLSDKAQTEALLASLTGKDFSVVSVRTASKKKMPAPPFTTASLQQDAARKLGFQSARIMRIAQELYEGINLGAENGGVTGLITYMRTDSLRISEEAKEAAKAFLLTQYGDAYVPKKFREFKMKKGAQDAHEAIRPTHVELTPASVKSHLTTDQYKLYKLIWERFVASQMENATLATVSADFSCGDALFRTGGYAVEFPGYMALYEASEEEKNVDEDDSTDKRDLRLPTLTEGSVLEGRGLSPAQHFTTPPPRFNDASLVKFLEDMGLGRPSTYAAILTTIIERGYVKREQKQLTPTPIGELTCKLMKEHFPEIVDYRFTAGLETRLDEIGEGKADMEKVLSDFWVGFEKSLAAADSDLKDREIAVPVEETDLICEKCGRRMVIRNGRFGKFAACPGYPECRNTKPLTAEGTPEPVSPSAEKEKADRIVADFPCPKCGSEMVQRVGKYGAFFACSKYPTCDYTVQKHREMDLPCPLCGSRILIKSTRNRATFFSCEKYPECTFSTWDVPLAEKCPDCGSVLCRKKGSGAVVCYNKKCSYRRPADDEKGQKA